MLSFLLLFALSAPQINVIAHRGEHLQHAENSIAAIQSAIALGADFVELDIRTTRDGKLVLMHDKTVDRMTNGHGEVQSLTAQAIAELVFKDYGGGVPTFDQALEAAANKIKIYLDWKDATPQAIVEILRAHGMIGNVVVYGEQKQLHQLQKLAPGIRVMPEAVSSLNLRMGQDLLRPAVVAFDEDDFTPALIAQTLAHKEEIFVDRLGDQDTPAYWQDAIEKGAHGIQTNHPGELVQFLREKKLHP